MNSFFKRAFSLALPCIVALILSACSLLPSPTRTAQPAPGDSETESAAAEPASAQDVPAAVLEAPPQDPYLQQAVEVPAVTREAFARAVDAVRNEQWRSAESLLQQLTADYPDLSGPYLNLGIVYKNTDRLEEAEKIFTHAIAVNSLNLEAYNQLALLQRESGQFEAAEKNYLAALRIWPRHPSSHKNIGILYDLYMGQWDQALEHFKIYQYLVGNEDKRIAGWIIDLERRIQARN